MSPVTGPTRVADPLIGLTVEGVASALESMLRAKALDQLAARVEALEAAGVEVCAGTG